ncbi:hypothetical protein D3C75_1234030 [compost metagenome]
MNITRRAEAILGMASALALYREHFLDECSVSGDAVADGMQEQRPHGKVKIEV